MSAARGRDAEPNLFHGVLNISVAHEIAPHVASQQVFNAEQRDAHVYPHDVVIDPEFLIAPVRIECIGKTIAPVDPVAVLVEHFAQNRQDKFPE